MKTKDKIIIGLSILCLILGWIAFLSEKEVVKVPIKIEVPVPPIKGETDTIILPPKLIRRNNNVIIDSTYYKKYQELKNQSDKDLLFKEAIEIKEYKTRFEEDSIFIDVYSKTRGTLLEQQVIYETKPYSIKVDTTLQIKVPTKNKIFVGGDIILPTQQGYNSSLKPSVAPGIIYVPKSNKTAWKFNYDIVNKNVSVGVYFNPFKKNNNKK